MFSDSSAADRATLTARSGDEHKEMRNPVFLPAGPQGSAICRLRISPGAHSTITSNGRQHTSQSVPNRWESTLVSMTSSNRWPQYGHWMEAEVSIEDSTSRNRPANQSHFS